MSARTCRFESYYPHHFGMTMKKFRVLFYKREPSKVIGEQVETTLTGSSAKSLREEIIRMYPEFSISVISIVKV